MSISDRLDEIQARADKALAGPWEVNPFAHSVRKSGTNKVVCRISVLDNASFISASRTDVPAMLAALRAVLDLHVGVVDCCDECSPIKCAVCEAWEWPCDTIRAIEAALQEGL